jgi:HEAT repeat protein
VRAAAAESLFRVGTAARDAVKELTAAVAASKTKELWPVRLNAAMALQRIGRPDGLPAVPELLAALREEAPANLSPEERRQLTDVRRQMIETLGALGDVAAAGLLRETVERSLETKDSTLGRAALVALTKLAGDRKPLLPVLVKVMAPAPGQLHDQFMRCEAIHAIGGLGKELGDQSKVVVPNLRAALGDKQIEVRLAAIYALGELGPEAVGEHVKPIVAQLMVLKRSSEKAVAEAAAATIEKLQK